MRLIVVVAAGLLVGCQPEAEPSTSTGGATSGTNVSALEAPPLWGAPIEALSDGRFAIPDAESDSVFLVKGQTSSRIRFPAGSRPSRVVATGDDLAVLLRGSGQLARVAAKSGVAPTEALSFACSEPRGLAYDAPKDTVLVACASGALVKLSPSERTVVNTDLELRDVLVVNGTTWVTKFRTAEVVALDETGKVTETIPAPTRGLNGFTFTPRVAWRAVADGPRIVMVHQLHLDQEVASFTNPTPVVPYYGKPLCDASVVTSAVTTFDTTTKTVVWSKPIVGAVPIDVAADDGRIAVALAGAGRLIEIDAHSASLAFSCLAPTRTEGPGTVPIGVGYVNHELKWFDQSGQVHLPDAPEVKELGVLPVRALDPGRQLFHAESPSGVACASCHPEGYDDGHTWHFGNHRLRSQSLEGGLLKTAPFHWDGRLSSVKAVLDETFVRRMGGANPDLSQSDAVAKWLDGVPARGGEGSFDRYAAKRGRVVFEDAQCGTCHAGDALTNGATVDVGTGRAFQVPSLKALRWRGPWMHDGCAKTLEQRFDPACGGKNHGNAVAPEDVPDLVEYLKAL